VTIYPETFNYTVRNVFSGYSTGILPHELEHRLLRACFL